MKTSERLESIVDKVRDARTYMNRLALGLPEGATLDVLDSCEARVSHVIALLNDEARKLRRYND